MVVYIILALLEKVAGLVFSPNNLVAVIQSLCILSAGLFGFITAGLLGKRKVRTGFFWGNSWPGCLFLGIGLTAFSLLRMLQTALSFQAYMILVFLSLFFLAGLVIEYVTRKKILVS